MANKTDLVEKWESRIKDGKLVQEEWIKTFRIADLDKYYEGHQRPANWQEDDWITVNILFANMKTQMDALYARAPQFVVRPTSTRLPAHPEVTKALEQQGLIRQSVANYLFKEKQYKREIKKSLLDAFIAFGVTKTFYEPYLEANPDKGKPFLDGNQLPAINRETGEELIQPAELLVSENFEVSRRNPLNIIFDPWADSRETLMWVAEEVEYTIEEIEDNELFSNTDGIVPTDVLTASIGDQVKKREKERKHGTEVVKNKGWGFAGDEKGKQQVVTCYEIYDLVENKIIVIAHGHDTELREDDTPAGIEGHPYKFLSFIERRDSPYPIPEIWNQLGVQDEYNVTRNQTLLHRKRYSRKYIVEEGAMEEDELSKLEEPYDGMVVKKKQGMKSPEPIIDASLDQAVYFDTAQLKKDFMDIAGSAGEGDIANIEKATVAALVDKRAEARTSGKQGEVEDFITDIAEDVIMLIDAELTIPMAVAIVGPAGQQWQPIGPGDIKTLHSEYSFEIIPGSMSPKNLDVERGQWLQFVQAVTLTPQIGMSEHLIRKTAEYFRITDETMIQELMTVLQAIMKQQQEGGQVGRPGVASQPGNSEGVA